MSAAAIISEIAETAGKFSSSIVVEFDDKYIDAKSVLGLFTTLIESKKYTLRITGSDSEKAKSAMKHVFEKNGFVVTIVDQEV